MTNAQWAWLGKLTLNLLGLLVALWFVYRAGINVLLLFSYRSLSRNPLYGILRYDIFVVLIGLVAIWACFRTVENLYRLAMHPPRV